MKILARYYDRILEQSAHKDAPKILCSLSFAEAVFFPIPPDVMIIPMAIKQPAKAVYFATLATIFSVLGGILGYIVGYFLSSGVENLLEYLGYTEKFATLMAWFDLYGVWVVFITGLTPIPYKLVTLLSGALVMNFPLFMLASISSRALRIFTVALLAALGGKHFERQIRRGIELFGGFVLVAIALYGAYIVLS